MPRVLAKPDNLNELNTQFEQTPLKHPVFLNSVPKCGTHLIRNIFRMFVPVDQQYHNAFIQIPILQQNLHAFSKTAPKLSWGHLLFSDDSAIALHKVKHIVVVRDPYDWVLARARFFLSDTFQGSLEHLKNGKVTIEQVLNMMIFGIYQKAPTMHEIFTHNAVAWLGQDTHLVRYEDLIHHLKNIDKGAAQDYFEDLLSVCGFETFPEDWKQRILTGSDRKQSGTARENLSGKKFDIPNELPEMQKQMVNYAAPGLRKMLGYE
ncbi:sulfotransferase domain-containing protein [Pleionea sp. CnH1-48]|uniref:sulfotransferase domain-containing protein n=1 Tax=Pleionea sp. CnH1-48 TaxID=2954494 RepID=UPI0020971AB1|nr:sulfotransferase domain-containing protein [Pleionea sp. CnH1-48]MCO7227236.1 sulfotransferase domain-containing protein [Pleionea sp. CnH1-48]